MVTLTRGTATFDNENVGTGKTVTLTGVDADRRGRGQLRARLGRRRRRRTSRRSTVTGSFTADNKVYDGNDDGDGPTRTLTGRASAATS